MLARNTVVSCCCFAFDLALLWALVRCGGLGQAAGGGDRLRRREHAPLCARPIAGSSAAPIARSRSGYVFFLVNAGVGLAVTMVLYAAFLRYTPINYLVARMMVSVFAGLAVFVLNAVLEFPQALMRIALFSGNYNYLREGANQALNRLVGYLEAQAGHQVRVYSPVTATPAFEPAGTLVPVPSVRLPVRGEFQLALGLPRVDPARCRARSRPDLDPRLDPRHPRHARADLCRAAGLADRRQPAHALRDLPRLITGSAGSRRWSKRICAASTGAAIMCSRRPPPWSPRSRRCAATIMPACGAAASTATCSAPNGADLDWRRAHGIADDEIALLFFGRLVLEKGVDLFVEVVAALQRAAA